MVKILFNILVLEFLFHVRKLVWGAGDGRWGIWYKSDLKVLFSMWEELTSNRFCEDIEVIMIAFEDLFFY